MTIITEMDEEPGRPLTLLLAFVPRDARLLDLGGDAQHHGDGEQVSHLDHEALLWGWGQTVRGDCDRTHPTHQHPTAFTREPNRNPLEHRFALPRAPSIG